MQKRLAAVLAADVVGYSALMDHNRDQTLKSLKAFREETLMPALVEHAGRLIKSMGDGWIVEFRSASNAAECAISIQSAEKPADIQLRIGVHTGEVITDGEDIFGDGINIAARLEALAEPGQILLSDTAHNSLDRTAAALFFGGGRAPQPRQFATSDVRLGLKHGLFDGVYALIQPGDGRLGPVCKPERKIGHETAHRARSVAPFDGGDKIGDCHQRANPNTHDTSRLKPEPHRDHVFGFRPRIEVHAAQVQHDTAPMLRAARAGFFGGQRFDHILIQTTGLQKAFGPGMIAAQMQPAERAGIRRQMRGIHRLRPA